MTSRAVTVLCVAVAAGLGWAQAPSADEAATGAFVGVVTGTDVYVRSGPDDGAPPCTMLSKPQRVSVVGKRRQWLEIEPPADCYSVVEKDYVKTDLTGKIGTVSAATVFARAAGPLLQEKFALIQRRLKEGETVEIIGTVGNYYKIASPPGAHLFIADQFVVPLSRYEATEKARGAPLVPVGRKSPTGETLTVVPPGGTDTARPSAPPTADDRTFPRTTWPPGPAAGAKRPAPAAPQSARQAFVAAEGAFKAECRKPADQRDYEAILARYEAIRVGTDTYLAPYLAERVKFLEQTIADQKALADAEKLLKEATAKQKEYDLKLSEAEIAIPQTRPTNEYAAKGVVMASDLFPGGATSPKRYVLRDPSSGGIKAYLQSATTEVNLASYDRKYVGIVGKSKYDAALMSEVISVELVVLLDEEAKLPAPPKPVVAPVAPKPEEAAKAVTPPAPAPPVAPAKFPPVPAPLPTKRPAPPAPVPETPRAPETPKKHPGGPPLLLPTKRPARVPVTPPPLEPSSEAQLPAAPVAPRPPAAEPRLRPKEVPALPPSAKPLPTTRPILLPGPEAKAPVAPEPKKAAPPVPPPPLDLPLERGKKTPPAAEPTTRPVAPKPPTAKPTKGLPLVDPSGKPAKPPVDAREFQ